MGAEAAMAPATMWGYLTRNQAANIPKQGRSQGVGSAGAFEVLVSMSGANLDESDYVEINIEKISALYVQILGSSKIEKLSMHGLPKERVDYISGAFVLIWHIIDTVQPRQILVSKYAMKEGVLSTFLD